MNCITSKTAYWSAERVFAVTVCALIGAMTASTHAQEVFVADTTPSWRTVIAHYAAMAEQHPNAFLTEIGKDDGGETIHLFVITDGSAPDPATQRANGKNIFLITNGIHPGEPDGIDASLMLARSLLTDNLLSSLTARTTVCIVPIYNVSGARERRAHSRANQNGPTVCGFRGNARNLDLNRDLMKMDARNTQALVQAMRSWDPDIYLDTHVSNGSDHQYVMQLLTTHKDNMPPALADFTTKVLEPDLLKILEKKGVPTCRYFETVGEIPDSGLVAFFDHPRYTTGFASLFNTIGFMSETHMLKPYATRVNATYHLMLAMLQAMEDHQKALQKARETAKAHALAATRIPLRWSLDTLKSEVVQFTGFTAEKRTSDVSGTPRWYYDETRPHTFPVVRFDQYVPTHWSDKPSAYLVPQAWREVIQRLAITGVEMTRVQRDTTFTAERYSIGEMSGTPRLQEGRYKHQFVPVELSVEEVNARAGDMIIPMGRVTDRFVMEALEPQAVDSYFAWGFFDSILQRKEYYSPYVFEDIASELLKTDGALKAAFEERKRSDPAFAADGAAQLHFIYERSDYAEHGYRRYPVVRMVK